MLGSVGGVIPSLLRWVVFAPDPQQDSHAPTPTVCHMRGDHSPASLKPRLAETVRLSMPIGRPDLLMSSVLMSLSSLSSWLLAS
jgi:hypothetical protein